MYVCRCLSDAHTYIHTPAWLLFSCSLASKCIHTCEKNKRITYTRRRSMLFFFKKNSRSLFRCMCMYGDGLISSDERVGVFIHFVLFYERGSTFNRIFRYGNLIHTVHGVSSHWLECHCCCCCFQYVHAPTGLRMWIFLRIDWQQEWARAKETESCTDLIENFTGIFLSGRLNTTMSFYDIHRIKQSTKRPNNECINGGLRLTRNHAHCCINVCVV